MASLDDTLADTVLALLAGAERFTLPTLTREEIHALGLPPTHQLDARWDEALTDRERALLGAAGTRSLAVRELVHLVDGRLEPVDDLLVVACAITAPAWSVLLSGSPDSTQLLLRGLPGTEACVVTAYADGIHAHALATRDAGVREAASWLLDPDAAGDVRAVAVVSAHHPAGVQARVGRDGTRFVLHADADGGAGGMSLAGADELAAWLGRTVTGAY